MCVCVWAVGCGVSGVKKKEHTNRMNSEPPVIQKAFSVQLYVCAYVHTLLYVESEVLSFKVGLVFVLNLWCFGVHFEQ